MFTWVSFNSKLSKKKEGAEVFYPKSVLVWLSSYTLTPNKILI
jgi:hypothetical protein